MSQKIKLAVSSELFPIISGGILFVIGLILSALDLEIASAVVFAVALAVAGIRVYVDAVKGIIRRDLLDEKFLMSIASIGAMLVGEYTEGVAVMLFYLLGEAFEHKAVARSRGKIRALMDICPDEATVIRDGKEERIDADEVEVGNTVIIKAGERVAVDVKVISGYADVDTSAITGESILRPAKNGSIIESGSIVIGGSLICVAEKTSENSSAQRVLEMVENATENKAAEERFIGAFARVYTPVVVGLAVLLATLPSIFGITEWSDSVYRALIFLVISCPCALVISVPLAFFGGIGSAASLGVLFKGGSSFSTLSRVQNVAFDKTGTLTSGSFKISKVTAIGVSEDELINLAAAVERCSDHPIARAFSNMGSKSITASDIRELAGRGTVGSVDGKRVCVGNLELMRNEGVSTEICSNSSSSSTVYVSQNGSLIGVIEIADEIRPEAKNAIEKLIKVGIKRTFMLSGDKTSRAEAIGKELSIDEIRGELLPDEKYEELKRIKEGGVTMYVGDGINDAPSLAIADVGVAMGGAGSDSAIEASDLVIMSDDLSRLTDAICIARKTLSIARFNIVFALGVKIVVMILGALGASGMWLAVFADVGVAVIAILIAMQTLLFGRESK